MLFFGRSRVSFKVFSPDFSPPRHKGTKIKPKNLF
jgi:hypothetical protein